MALTEDRTLRDRPLRDFMTFSEAMKALRLTNPAELSNKLPQRVSSIFKIRKYSLNKANIVIPVEDVQFAAVILDCWEAGLLELPALSADRFAEAEYWRQYVGSYTWEELLERLAWVDPSVEMSGDKRVDLVKQIIDTRAGMDKIGNKSLKRFLTITQYAEYTKVSRQTVYSRIEANQLERPVFNFEGLTLIEMPEADSMLLRFQDRTSVKVPA